jgi:hypothetical protein
MAPVTVATGTKAYGRRSRSRQRRYAVGKRPEEDPERPLGDAIPGEADQNAGRKPRRRQGQGHQQDRKDDRHDRHDRRCDVGQDGLGNLRIGPRWEQDPGNQGTDRRNVFFQPRKNGPGGAERQSDDEGANEKTAPKRIGRRTDKRRQALGSNRHWWK